MEHRLIYNLPSGDPRLDASIEEWLQSYGIISETVSRIEIDPAMAIVKITTKRTVASGSRKFHGHEMTTRRVLPEDVRLFFNFDRLPDFIEPSGLMSCGHPLDDRGSRGCLRCRKEARR